MFPAARHALLLLAAGFALAATGCQETTTGPEPHAVDPALAPLLERMRRAYPDLQSGPFVCMAAFESADEADLLRVLDPQGRQSTRTQPWINILRSREDTGVGSLAVRLADPGDVLLMDAARSRQRSVPRDWRPYHLLLMSLYAPPGGLTIEAGVLSGDDPLLRWSRTQRLDPGWNLLRFDLAEIGEAIDLSDVRALSWRAPGAAPPVELGLDDLVLADNSRYFLGSEATTDQLRVVRRGRRIHVGFPGRFELAFADGVICDWRGELGENLTVRGGLGPWPLPLAAAWDDRRPPPAYDDPALFAAWGTTVAARQQLVEASPARVVVAGEWRFAAPGDMAQDRPLHRWRYCVYPHGQVYVQTTSTWGSGAGWPAERAGYAVALDGRRGFERIAADAPASAGGPAFNLLTRRGPQAADLLWCPAAPEWAARGELLASGDGRRVAVVSGDAAAADSVRCAHLLRFWPADIDGAREAASLAGDYQSPAAIVVSAGGVVRDAEGDDDGDGFNEAEGCYELYASAQGVLRFVFDPGERVRHGPNFRVRRTGGARCWVYVEGRVVDVAGRDAAGDVLFSLPAAIDSPRRVEVHVRGEAGGAAS